MELFDVVFTLDSNHTITEIEWENPQLEDLYNSLFLTFIGKSVFSLFPIRSGESSGEFTWKNESFSFLVRPATQGGAELFLKQIDQSVYLMAKTLDLVTEGVQIYDKNARAVFFNKSTRKISGIPADVRVEGRHLLDLYALDESISTTLTALTTQSPVINRVDHFKLNNGKFIATANTAYPIRKGKELVGAVAFDTDASVIRASIQKMEGIQKALNSYDANRQEISFSGYNFDHIIGHGKKMVEAVGLAKKMAPQNCNILLVGETGTGKEIYAQSIHRASRRSSKKFVALNCAAIPESLIESLLFGTQKGSFTGSEDRAGYFEQADGGTLFLDELNSMSLGMQSKLLRVLQENTFRRVGGQKELHTDIRFIASCNEDPFQAISENRLRQDLFYRLSTVMIELPALREHLEDLGELIGFHLDACAFQFVNPIEHVDYEVMELFRQYQWPGNVRELFHVLDYALNVADSDTLRLEHLPSYLLKQMNAKKALRENLLPERPSADFLNRSLQEIMDEYEQQVLLQVLEHYGYNITKTAEALGLRRQSLQYRIRKFGIIM